MSHQIQFQITVEKINRIKSIKVYSKKQQKIRSDILERTCLLKIYSWQQKIQQEEKDNYVKKLNLELKKNLQSITQKCQICFKEIPFNKIKIHSMNCRIRKYLQQEIDAINDILSKKCISSNKLLKEIKIDKIKLKKRKRTMTKRTMTKRQKKIQEKKNLIKQKVKKSIFATIKFKNPDSSNLSNSQDSNNLIAVVNA